MDLSDKQRIALTKAAVDSKVDVAALIRAAERINAPEDKTTSNEMEQGALYMYLLPFVTVREVRELFLRVPGRIADDEMNAAEFAARIVARVQPTITPASDDAGDENNTT